MPVHSKLASVGGGTPKSYKDLLRHFFCTIWQYRYGKPLISVWGSSIAAAVIYGLFFRRRPKRRRRKTTTPDKKQSEEKQSPASKGAPKFMTQLKAILKIINPSLLSKHSAMIVLYTAVLATRVLLTIKLSSLAGNLGSYMGAKDWNAMFRAQAVFGMWCFPAALSNGLMKYLERAIFLLYRKRLVEYIHTQYFPNKKFYAMQQASDAEAIAHLDQRITQDAEMFSHSIVHIYGHIVKPGLDTLFLSHTLSKLMGAQQLAFFFAFFAVVNKLISFVKPRFSTLAARKQEYEGQFRTQHSRVITYAEEIAFLRGGPHEHQKSNEIFSGLFAHESHANLLHLFADVVDSYVLKYGGMMMAYSALIPATYLERSRATATQITARYLHSSQLLVALGSAIKDITLSYKMVATLEGLTGRVYAMVKQLQFRPQLADADHRAHPGAREIALDDVCVVTPANEPLINNLTVSVKSGTNLILTGKNGTGKTSLFRVLAGLWPVEKGSVRVPGSRDIVFVPQKAYMTAGSLWDQVTYPDFVPVTSEGEARVRELLTVVDLDRIVKRYGLHRSVDWLDTLSGGEKQRLAMARLYYHRPAFAVLDEATSAMSADIVPRIYEQCQALGITLLTIAHDSELSRFHDIELHLEKGRWSLNDLKASGNTRK